MMEYIGFARHRPGRIHLFCPRCHRKLSNIRMERHDPPSAVLAHIHCERCSDGGWVEGASKYLDRHGQELCQYCGRTDCDVVGGVHICDESLLEPIQ